MLTDTNTTVAALRTRSESPFVLPTGASMPWQPAASVPGDTTGAFGAQHGSRYQDTGLMIVSPATIVGPDVRVTAKQDRPPRWVPR